MGLKGGSEWYRPWQQSGALGHKAELKDYVVPGTERGASAGQRGPFIYSWGVRQGLNQHQIHEAHTDTDVGKTGNADHEAETAHDFSSRK